MIQYTGQLSRRIAIGGPEEDIVAVVTFRAGDANELRKAFDVGEKVLEERLQKRNAQVLSAADEVETRVHQIRAQIRRERDKELADAGIIPQNLVGMGVNGADAPAGSPESRHDS